MNVATQPRLAPVAADRTSARRRVRLACVALVGVLGVTACTSDPGPKRVARDIIEAEAIRNPDLDEECLLAELDKFTDDDLRRIDEDLAASNTDRNSDGEAALLAYQRSLEVCL